MGRDYQLYISFPYGYSNSDTVSYPVLYVLDGGAVAFFETMDLAHRYLGYNNGIEKVILVGIESGIDGISWHINRVFDYTPSADTVVERNADKERSQPKGTFRSGGAVKFLECLKSEIIPFVDKHYKTTNDRGITGHSLGGLFAAWCFINSQGFFTRYGINSPVLSWNKEEILNQAIEKFKENKTWNVPPTKVFISAGGLEGPLILPTMIKFSTHLESKNYPTIDLTWKIFDDETHLSVVPAMMSRTISVLYGKMKKNSP
jgi:predicted alpha/beta superfamily hydrolase